MLAAVVVTAAAGCSGGAGAEGPQPTVVDSLPSIEEHDDVTHDERENANSSASDEKEHPTEDSDDEPSPIPASSEGPAQNWPEPEPPEEIYEPTEEGAEALIQYWFDARHYARITGDTGPLEHFSLEDCDLCNSHLERLDEVFSNEGWYVSEPDSVEDFYLRMESETVVSGLVALAESDFESYWGGEFYSETIADTIEAFGFAFYFEEGRWQMAELNYLDEYDPSHDETQSSQELVEGRAVSGVLPVVDHEVKGCAE